MPDARRVFSTLVSLSWMGSKIIIQTSFGCPASSPIGAIPSLGLRSFLLIHRTQCTHISSSLSLSALSPWEASKGGDWRELSLSQLSLSLREASRARDRCELYLSQLSLSLSSLILIHTLKFVFSLLQVQCWFFFACVLYERYSRHAPNILNSLRPLIVTD
jgi:hypothetical protein